MRSLFRGLIIALFLPGIAFGADINEIAAVKNIVKKDYPPENEFLTLMGCYKLALKRSEIIAIDAEKIKEAEAHFLQALGTLMPQVSFSRVETRQHSQSSPSYNKTFEQKFIFTQALFSGFKEFAGIASGKLEKKQRENEKIRAQQLLFVDVSDAFYLLLEEREDLKTLESIKNSFINRIEELKARVDLGKSRNSEVVSTETQLYSLEDEIESIKSREQIARQLLEFLAGLPVNEISESDAELPLGPESEYLARAAARTDVRAANFAWQVDEKGVSIAKSGFFPTLNLESDYYAHRSSTPTDSRWKTLLTFDVPIFEGTTTYGKVKEAFSKARESELQFNRTARLALQDIHDSYVNARTAYLRKGVLEKALKSAEKNYDLQLQDYKLSVVNNLDVLTAIQSLENIRRNFNHVSYEGKRFYWQLQVAAGEIDLKT